MLLWILVPTTRLSDSFITTYSRKDEAATQASTARHQANYARHQFTSWYLLGEKDHIHFRWTFWDPPSMLLWITPSRRVCNVAMDLRVQVRHAPGTLDSSFKFLKLRFGNNLTYITWPSQWPCGHRMACGRKLPEGPGLWPNGYHVERLVTVWRWPGSNPGDTALTSEQHHQCNLTSKLQFFEGDVAMDDSIGGS